MPYFHYLDNQKIYNRARYYLAIDYNKESVPPLKSEDTLWSDTFYANKG
ncbi:DUF4058 family protein [Nostoc sp.]